MPSQLTAEERTRVHTLYHDAGFTKTQIHHRTGYSISQIKRAIQNPIPQFNKRGRMQTLTQHEQDLLVQHVTKSNQGRKASWAELAKNSESIIGRPVGLYTIRSTMRRLGFK